ncbi:7-carboxy-7-deazaguanine synthase QueE [bacterium]|nr:7-carboxy-7-deazaguanine synthase QueE [bacterium]
MKGRIIEIFSSVQGEGLWLGIEQIFVRFHGCKLKCSYCDTPLTHHAITKSRVEVFPYTQEFENHALEYGVEELNATLSSFKLQSIAITGGEPLEQVEFLEAWLPTLKTQYQILLETSGIEVEAFKLIKQYVDMASMDIKLPSSSGEKPYWKEHDLFLEQTLPHKVYAKIVFNEKMTPEEEGHLETLFNKYPELPVVFQPVSPLRSINLQEALLKARRFSQKFGPRIRVIPQVHKYLAVM